MKKIHALGLSFCLFLTLLSLGGCGKTTEPISKTGFYFDTVITITLYDASYEKELDHCFSMAEKYEDLFSAQKEGTDIWKINHSQGQAVEVSDETINILNAGIAYSKSSNGKFDITVGKLSSLWDFSESSSKEIPSVEAIQKALATINYQNIVIDGNMVSLTDPNAAIDLGGIAKGYIADQMKAYLNQKGITSGYINLGGNVLALGAKTDGSAYTIGIQRPFGEENEAIASVSITDQTVVSSGVYERYFEVDGTRYHHILDTATGYPYDNGLLEVTIITGASVDGDGLSTTCFSLGLEDGMALVESLDATEAIFITDDYEVHTSSGMGTVIPYEILED